MVDDNLKKATLKDLLTMCLGQKEPALMGGDRPFYPETDWVRESTRKQVENDTPYGYGYLFWGDQHGAFRSDGKYCQISMIMRDKRAVVTTIAECWDGDALREAIFSEIYPQL